MICCSGHETEEIVSDVIHALEDQGEYINPEQLEMDYPDPKDAVFYEVVMEKTLGKMEYNYSLFEG